MEYRTQPEVGARIDELRRNHNLTQEDMARVLGVGQPTINKIIHGSRPLAVGELIVLADYFGVDTASILAKEPALVALRAPEGESEAVDESLRLVRELIQDHFGGEALVS